MKEQLKKLDNDSLLKKLEDKLNEPNIFSILKMESYEIRHSNFLAWLLDPNESHKLGDSFLKQFLNDIFIDDKVSFVKNDEVDEYISKIEFKNIKVLRETYNIDLLIISDNFVICIENKIYAKEHSDQLSKYIETLKEVFKNKNHIFIFLTPFGDSTKKEETSNIYINYSYKKIKGNIESIIDKATIDNKVKFYIEDYLSNLGTNIMNDSEEIKLVQEIYRNHKKAFDFILKKKEDFLAKVIAEAVEEKGYVLASQSKGYCRFLTKDIEFVIPKTGTGWTNKESFLFEIKYEKNLEFKVVVSKGDSSVKDFFYKNLYAITGFNKPRGKEWNVYYVDKITIDFNDEKYILEDDLIKNEIFYLLEKNDSIIKEVEKKILERKDDFIKFSKS